MPRMDATSYPSVPSPGQTGCFDVTPDAADALVRKSHVEMRELPGSQPPQLFSMTESESWSAPRCDPTLSAMRLYDDAPARDG